MAKRVPILGWFLCLLVLPRSALAEDACSSLFVTEPASAATESCVLLRGLRQFDEHVPPPCAKAARAGEAAESVARLYAIAATQERANFCQDEPLHAMYALCALRPPNHRSWFRRGIPAKPLLTTYNLDLNVTGRCLLALLEQGDEQALADTLGNCNGKSGPIDCRAELLGRLFEHAPDDMLELLVPALQAAHQQRLEGRDRLHRILCQRGGARATRLRAVCAAIPEDEEAMEAAAEGRAAERSQRNRTLGKRIGLTAMSVALAGLQVGLTVRYPDQVAGQLMTTVGGLAAGSFIVTDVSVARLDTLYVLGLLFLPLGLLAGGVGGYASSLNPTSAIVSSSITAAFSLASGVALSWTL